MTSSYAKDQPAGFNNHVKNVAIVGAGGQSGGVITEALIRAGKHNLTAVTRPDSQNTLPSELHDIKKVDYQDHGSLVQALKGQDVLIITMFSMAPADTQYRLIDAAVEAGVAWIMPNEWGTDLTGKPQVAKDTMLGERIAAVRKHIEMKGGNKTHFIGLACGFWYEFSLRGTERQYGFNFPKKTVTFYDDGNTKINTTTWHHVGEAVARLLSLKILPEDEKDESLTLSRYANSSVRVASFFVSQRDMFDSVLRVTGGMESDWTIKHEDVAERFSRGRQIMGQGDMFGFQIALYARMFYKDGAGDFNATLQNGVLGLGEENLDEATKSAIEATRNQYSRE